MAIRGVIHFFSLLCLFNHRVDQRQCFTTRYRRPRLEKGIQRSCNLFLTLLVVILLSSSSAAAAVAASADPSFSPFSCLGKGRLILLLLGAAWEGTRLRPTLLLPVFASFSSVTPGLALSMSRCASHIVHSNRNGSIDSVRKTKEILDGAATSNEISKAVLLPAASLLLYIKTVEKAPGVMCFSLYATIPWCKLLVLPRHESPAYRQGTLYDDIFCRR